MMKRFIGHCYVYVYGINARFEREYVVHRRYSHEEGKFIERLVIRQDYGIFPMPYHYKEDSGETYEEYLKRIDYCDEMVTRFLDYGNMMPDKNGELYYFAWQLLNYRAHTIQRAFKKNLVLKRKLRSIQYFLEKQGENKYLCDELVLRNIMSYV